MNKVLYFFYNNKKIIIIIIIILFLFINFLLGGGWRKVGFVGAKWGVERQIFILIPQLVILERIESLRLTYTANGKRQVENFSK